MDPSPGSNGLAQLIHLMEELLSRKLAGEISDGKPEASKMSFSIFKQQSSDSQNVFSKFYSFEESVMDLQRSLQDFSNSVQHLGSSVGLVASAYHVRFRLDGILRLFRGNVSKIYPDHPLRLPPTRNLIDPAPRAIGDLARVYALVDLSTQALPEECMHLTDDLLRFLQRIKEIPDFTDDIVAELLDSTIHTLCDHMAEWMASLKEYENLDWSDVRTFINELSSEVQLDVERLSRSVKSFVSVGIPMIEHAQKRRANGLLNLSTVATFFSGVTATALQYSLETNQTGIEQVVNFSWTSALVFSLASAVSSQIAYRWHVTAHSSPHTLVPVWLFRCLTDAPLLFLVASSILFILGLVCFSFSAFSGSFIPITTSIFAGASSIGLLIVCSWVLGEQVAYAKTRGHHWLNEIISRPQEAFGDGFSWIRCLLPSFLQRSGDGLFPSLRRRWRLLHFRARETVGLPDGRSPRPGSYRESSDHVLPTNASIAMMSRLSDVEKSGPRSSGPLQSPPRTPQRASTPLPPTSESKGSEGSSTLLSPSSASRAVTTEASALSSGRRPRTPNPARRSHTPGLHTWRHADMLVSLRNIALIHELTDIEVPYPRIMEFSPMGTYLAALCPNQKIRVWETQTMTQRNELSPRDGALQQIIWRPQYSSDPQQSTLHERVVLLRSTEKTVIRLVDVFETHPGRKGIVWHRPKGTKIGSMCWLRETPSFLWSEGSSVYIGSTEPPNSQQGQGQYKLFHDFNYIARDRDGLDIVINCMLAIPGDRFLIMTIVLAPNADNVSETRNPEHRVILFNIQKMRVETYFATFDEVDQISIAKTGMFVLITPKKRPPTVYELKNRESRDKNGWLQPLLTCTGPKDLEFIGTSILASVLPEGGQTILSSTKDGVLHVWDRKFGTKLGELVPEDAVPGQTVDSVIWSQDKALLAIAYSKGSIRIFQVRDVLRSSDQPDNHGSRDAGLGPGSSERASGPKAGNGASLINQYTEADKSRRKEDKAS